MNKYNLRKNFTAVYSNNNVRIRGKLAFKTKELDWLETHNPVIVLVSVYSAFHEEIGGDLKMNALLSTIRRHVKGKVTVLLSDRAHFHTNSLEYQENVKQTYEESLKKAYSLKSRYQPYFDDCTVVYWHSYIYQEEQFAECLTFLKNIYEADSAFRELVNLDANGSYMNRQNEMLNKERYLIKAKEDILEQCAAIFILAKKGYRFQFYPGSSNLSVEYINKVYIPEQQRISWINVFLTIEKKTVIN